MNDLETILKMLNRAKLNYTHQRGEEYRHSKSSSTETGVFDHISVEDGGYAGFVSEFVFKDGSLYHMCAWE
jgi:hypothetical protein